MGNEDNRDDFITFLAIWGATVAGVISIMFLVIHLGNLSANLR